MSSDTSFDYTGKGHRGIRNGQIVPTNVVNVRFHPSVIEVGPRAFCKCHKLKKVVFNEGIQKICWQAFAYCTSLERISIPATVTTISGFEHCYNLRKVVLNVGTQKIADNTFHACQSLQTITLPSTITYIGSNAFSGCITLREVRLPGGLQTIGRDAFHRCPLLSMFTFPCISARMKAIISLGSIVTENKINELLRYEILQRRDDDVLFVSAAAMDGGKNWATIKPSLDRTVKLIAYYELKEATVLFELALWKAKMDQEDGVSNNINREVYRMEVPGPVKETILQYLW